MYVVITKVCHFDVVDGTFSQAALKGKIQLKEQLPKYFGGEVKLGMFPMVFLVKGSLPA